MQLLPRIRSLWHHLFHKAKREHELTDEIDAYLELLIEQKIEEGVEPEEARRAALVEFGGKEQVKEEVRQVSAGYFLETLWHDLGYGLRMLGRNPGFTTVAVLTFSLGIGANSAIFSVVNAVLLRPLPYPNPDRIVTVGLHRSNQATAIVLGRDYLYWRGQAKVFERIAAYTT